MKKYSNILILLLLIVFASGCDKIYTLVHKEGAEEKALIGTLVPFEPNPTVEEIQMLLNLYGYGCGEPDGILGGMTREAIARFQKDNGLEVTRFVDDATWASLKKMRDSGLVNKRNYELNVKLIQKILNEAGHPVGAADGVLGPQTIKAVKDFQKQNGLAVDGQIGYRTLVVLSQYLRPAFEEKAQKQ